MKNLNLRQKLYQMFILGYKGDDPLSECNEGFVDALNQGLGGVIFFTENITDRNLFKESVKKIKKEALITPFLSIDQEGGRVERTLNLYNGSHYVSAADGAKSGEDFVKKQTKEIAEELKDFGLNMNFAPVLDVNTNLENPIIAERAFSDSPDVVSKYGKIVAQTYLENGILPVGKHFPGHGDTSVDSHKEMPQVNLSLPEMESVHIKPFVDLINILPAIMVAHVHYSAFDTEMIPASVSQNIIQGYLRQDLGYKGLVISDDMVMGGIKRFSSLEACIRAINAGVNMFIFRNSDLKTLNLINDLEKAVADKKISMDNIDKSIEIIRKIKCC